jgi:hypothetical protein
MLNQLKKRSPHGANDIQRGDNNEAFKQLA